MAILGPVATAAGVFVGTNVDDLVVLIALFHSNGSSGRPACRDIWVGQYLGMAVLVAMSMAAAVGLTVVPTRLVGFLGVVPLAIGGRGLVLAMRSDRQSSRPAKPPAVGVSSVVVLTLANGVDNFTVYTPLFRAETAAALGLTMVVFAALVAIWCTAAEWVTGRRQLTGRLEGVASYVVPVVFIVIGVLLVARSHPFALM